MPEISIPARSKEAAFGPEVILHVVTRTADCDNGKTIGWVAKRILLEMLRIQMRRRLPTRIHFRLAALAALCASALSAQDSVKELFGVAQERNARAVRNLEWNSRTEVLIDGKLAGVRIDKVQFDPRGRIQRTMVGTQATGRSGKAAS